MMVDKIVVISGGLGDIGSAIAMAFAKAGARIAIGDLADETLVVDKLNEMRAAGCKELLYQKVDVTAEGEVTGWFNLIQEKWGTPEVVIPNAGIVVPGALTGSGIQTTDVEKQLGVNFWGSYHLAVQGAKTMKAAGIPGRIVFIGSWAAERPNARISAYCISKAAVRMLCKSLALELAADNILVNEIAPGIVAGGLSRKNQQKDPELLKTHLDSIPTHTLVSPEEVAAHVLHLADFSCTNIIGTVVEVDGGISLTSKMTR